MNRVDSGEYQNVVHVDYQPLTIVPDTIELRKCKKLARNMPKIEADTKIPVAIK